jgi:hypothetical protein
MSRIEYALDPSVASSCMRTAVVPNALRNGKALTRAVDAMAGVRRSSRELEGRWKADIVRMLVRGAHRKAVALGRARVNERTDSIVYELLMGDVKGRNEEER